jgi:pilus assembly protein CpaF
MTNVTFQNDEHVMKIIQRIIAPIGRRIDESSPMVDARLADGSRVNAIIPPLSLVGRCSPSESSRDAVHGRRPGPLRHGHPGDVRVPGGLREGPPQHLRLRRHRLGKTTMLNILSSFIPDDERIVTIEDAAELQLRQEHVVTLEARRRTSRARAPSHRELVRNALRMRPDRIVVGECRSPRRSTCSRP